MHYFFQTTVLINESVKKLLWQFQQPALSKSFNSFKDCWLMIIGKVALYRILAVIKLFLLH